MEKCAAEDCDTVIDPDTAEFMCESCDRIYCDDCAPYMLILIPEEDGSELLDSCILCTEHPEFKEPVK
jgi:hypothetical protein